MADTALPRDATRARRPLPRRLRSEASAIAVIAHRDFIKLLRDRTRLLSELAFPLVLVLLLGPALQSGFRAPGGFDLTTFVFGGVLAQTLWQSSTLGLVSLIADREEDFSQEIFVSPVSRYAIVAGKIIGESLVALPTGVGILVVGLLIGVPLSPVVLLALLPVSLVIAVYGGSFGLLLLSRLLEPAGRPADLPVRPPAAVLPRGRVQPDPRSAAAARDPVGPVADALRGGAHAERDLRPPAERGGAGRHAARDQRRRDRQLLRPVRRRGNGILRPLGAESVGTPWKSRRPSNEATTPGRLSS